MSEELPQLKRLARQLIQADRALGGECLAPGVKLPVPMAAAPIVRPPARPAPVATQAPTVAGTKTPIPPPPPIPPSARGQALAAVEAQVRACGRCQLCQSRTNVVFGEGSAEAQLMFVGEAPGEEEDKQGRPFVGRAGELLTRMIVAMGLKREDVYIANVLKCRPPGNRTPNADEVEHCREHLMQQIRIIRPKFIVTLGNPATHALLQTTVGITRLRGQWQQLPTDQPELAGIRVMPTFHPAFLLRQYTPDNRGKVWSDLQEVMKELAAKG